MTVSWDEPGGRPSSLPAGSRPADGSPDLPEAGHEAAGRRRERCADTWSVLLFRLSYQRVPGPAMTQPASTGLTQKLNATSITCARQVIST